MVRYLRSDATGLSDNDIQDINNARNSMKRASEVMANKYKISSRRVYQIWRGVHPPIDPAEGTDKDITSGSEGSQNQVKKTEVNVRDADRGAAGGAKSKSKSTGITADDHILNALFEKEAKRGEKNKINGTRLLSLQ